MPLPCIITGEAITYYLAFISRMPIIAIAVALAAALGGGATIAAQNSLPGDALWSFKVHVNEEIRTAFAGSAEAKADTHINAIKARLAETEELAAEGKLDANTQSSISANFDIHARAVAQAIAELEAEKNFDVAADIAARYQATIAAQAASLAQISAAASAEESASISPILLKVRTTLDQASELSAEASAKAAAETSAGVNVKATNSETEAGVTASSSVEIGL